MTFNLCTNLPIVVILFVKPVIIIILNCYHFFFLQVAHQLFNCLTGFLSIYEQNEIIFAYNYIISVLFFFFVSFCFLV